ncbi:MAG: hypothetical protein NC483_07455 [Ruminococcus sp.]|nr:hypothetical protein [Ruminococcus sp.]
MKEGYFVNLAFDEAIKTYLANQQKQDGVIYNSFLVVTIRILVLIYGELNILNPYYLNNEVALFSNLSKYGLSKSDIAVFKEEFLSYYKFEEEYKKNKVKLKNPYFKTVLKSLVNMFVAKKRNGNVTFKEEEEFLDLAYTNHTTNPYRVSYSYLMGNDPTYIEDYYYNKLGEEDLTRDLGKPIDINLNLDALKYVGVNLSNITNMNNEEIIEAKNNAYNYFDVDISSPSKDYDLEDSVNFFKLHGKKVTSGNGYVDILLLMSVIITSFSVIAIIIFSLM